MFSLTKTKKKIVLGRTGQDRNFSKEGRLIKERRFTVQFIRFCFCERERERERDAACFFFFSSGIWLSENGLLVSEHNNRQAGKRGNFPFDDCYNHISTFVTYPSVASPLC